ALRACLADDLPALRVAVALADGRRVVAVDESVLADAANRHLDDAIAVLSDDGFLRDDVRDVLADRLADLQAMPRTITRGAVAPFGVRRGIRTEYGVGHPGRLPGRTSVLPEVVRGVLEHDVDAARAVAGLEEVLDHRVVLLRLLLVTRPRLRDDAADVAAGGRQLVLEGLLGGLVGGVGDPLSPPAGRPQVGDALLPEAFRRRADDRDLLLDGLEESLVGLQLLLGVPVLDLR